MTTSLGLRLAALWDFAAGFGSLLMTEINLELFFKLASPQPAGVMLIYYSLWLMVLALGTAYAVAAVNTRASLLRPHRWHAGACRRRSR